LSQVYVYYLLNINDLTLDRLCRHRYIFAMQVSNPLVPPSPGQPGAVPTPVANAPAAPDPTPSETNRPVTASRESEGGRNEAERQPGPDYRPGGNVDIQV
jgi:hypothetical protein